MVRIHHGSPLFNYVRPHRLAVQDPALSRRLQGFKSPWGRQIIFFFNVPFGRLAQLVERHPYKVDVRSSSLLTTTIRVRR
mgnify:CR=1 FL=1